MLVGGGHAHVGVLKMLAMAKMKGKRNYMEGTKITLVAKEIHTPYSGMLPGYVAGHYPYEDCHIDLRPLTRLAGATLIHAAATRIDPDEKLVYIEPLRSQNHCSERPPLRYDILSVNVGITPETRSVEGACKYSTPVKPIDGFIGRIQGLLEQSPQMHNTIENGVLENGKDRDASHSTKCNTIAIVGGGAGGLELCLALHHRLITLGKQIHTKFVIYTRTTILSGQNEYARRTFRGILSGKGIKVVEYAKVVEVKANSIRFQTTGCSDSDADLETKEEPFDQCLWCTNASAADWLRNSGMKTDEKGFLLVNQNLQSVSHREVFAAGDCATIQDHPRPKAGVFAVRQGKPLMENIIRSLAGVSRLKCYTPQSKYLSLISTGDKYAVGLWAAYGFRGQWVWSLKNWIDKSWMAKYTSEVRELLGKMTSPEQSVDLSAKTSFDSINPKLFCAGCGSKIGSDTLSNVIEMLKDSSYREVVSELEARDDAAILEVDHRKTLVHSVDFFRSFVDDPFVFGAIAANHSISDIYAMGADPKSALAIAVVPYGTEKKIESVLFQMLAGASSILSQAECSLSGGHSVQGSEMSLGFAVLGEVDRANLMRKGDLKVGQNVILTKAIGTGVLFAAEMTGLCKGKWITSALKSMLEPNHRALDIAREHKASACTDITGFGLAGHLIEMAVASKVNLFISFKGI